MRGEQAPLDRAGQRAPERVQVTIDGRRLRPVLQPRRAPVRYCRTGYSGLTVPLVTVSEIWIGIVSSVGIGPIPSSDRTSVPSRSGQP